MASLATCIQPRNKAPVYGLGCGSDVTNRPVDRRSLQSAASAHFVPVWKAFLENALDEDLDAGVDADTLMSGGGDPTQAGKMCRKCFSAYMTGVKTSRLHYKAICRRHLR